MGNLGSYQTMVILAKKVGGPRRLAIIIAAAGGILMCGVEAGGKAVWTRAKDRSGSRAINPPEETTFTVSVDTDCGPDLALHAGDKIRVLERAGDAMLVEIINDDHNPHVMAIDILTQISDFRDDSSL